MEKRKVIDELVQENGMENGMPARKTPQLLISDNNGKSLTSNNRIIIKSSSYLQPFTGAMQNMDMENSMRNKQQCGEGEKKRSNNRM